MDLHDVGRGRGGIDRALRRVVGPVQVMSVDSDWLYPPHQQELMVKQFLENGVRCEYQTVHSPHGHDGFLLENDQIGPLLTDFINGVDKGQDRTG